MYNTHVSVCSGYYNRTPQMGWFKQQRFIFHSCGGWKSKIKVLGSLISGENCLPGLQRTTAFLLCPHTVGRKRGEEESEEEGQSLSGVCFYPVGLGPTFMTSFNFNDLLKTILPNTVTLGVQASTQELRVGGGRQ